MQKGRPQARDSTFKATELPKLTLQISRGFSLQLQAMKDSLQSWDLLHSEVCVRQRGQHLLGLYSLNARSGPGWLGVARLRLGLPQSLEPSALRGLPGQEVGPRHPAVDASALTSPTGGLGHLLRQPLPCIGSPRPGPDHLQHTAHFCSLLLELGSCWRPGVLF